LRAGDLGLAEDYAERAIDIGRVLGANAEIVGTPVLAVVLVERDLLRAASDLVESFELTETQLQLDEVVVLLSAAESCGSRPGIASAA
jgi:hypothetical protein